MRDHGLNLRTRHVSWKMVRRLLQEADRRLAHWLDHTFQLPTLCVEGGLFWGGRGAR